MVKPPSCSPIGSLLAAVGALADTLRVRPPALWTDPRICQRFGSGRMSGRGADPRTQRRHGQQVAPHQERREKQRCRDHSCHVPVLLACNPAVHDRPRQPNHDDANHGRTTGPTQASMGVCMISPPSCRFSHPNRSSGLACRHTTSREPPGRTNEGRQGHIRSAHGPGLGPVDWRAFSRLAAAFLAVVVTEPSRSRSSPRHTG